MKTVLFYSSFITFIVIMMACQSISPGDTSQTDSVKTTQETYRDTGSVFTNENHEESVPDTFGILQFYKKHNMDSLALHFDTTETMEFVQSAKKAINRESFDKKEYVVYDGEGNLKMYFDPDSNLVLFKVDLAAGDAVEYDEYWFKNDMPVLYTSYEIADNMDDNGNYVENNEPNTVEACFFMEGILVYRVYHKAHNTKIDSFNVEDFRQQNETILSIIADLKKAASHKKRFTQQ